MFFPLTVIFAPLSSLLCPAVPDSGHEASVDAFVRRDGVAGGEKGGDESQVGQKTAAEEQAGFVTKILSRAADHRVLPDRGPGARLRPGGLHRGGRVAGAVAARQPRPHRTGSNPPL